MEEEKKIGTLIFYDRDDMKMAIDGWKWRLAITEFDNFLRAEIKHGDHEGEIYELYEKIRDRLWEELDSESVSIND